MVSVYLQDASVRNLLPVSRQVLTVLIQYATDRSADEKIQKEAAAGPPGALLEENATAKVTPRG